MSLAQALSTYLHLNLSIGVGFAGLALFALLCRKWNFVLSSRIELKLHYAMLAIVIAMTALHPLLPQNEIFSPPAKVWSASSLKDFARDYSPSDKGGYLSVPTPLGTSTIEADRIALAWVVLGVVLLVLGAISIGRDVWLLLRTARQSFVVRRIGRVQILVSDSIQVPYSYWFPGQANVVLPTSFLERSPDLKIAVAHELQHHRSGDTRWVYVMWFLRLICVANPAIYFWNQWINEIQEFACDETLIDQKKVESQAYARCLVEVAQTAIGGKRVSVCATGLTFQTGRNLLHRRISKMFVEEKNRKDWSIGVSLVAGVFLATVMGATALASKGFVQDRRVSLAQAKSMVAKAKGTSGFTVTLNQRVLTQLNRYIGTPEGRELMRNALSRMESHRQTVTDAIVLYGVPEELMAIPIVESGYENFAEGATSPTVKSAGIWQFIRSTAKVFGLRVDSTVDERMDVPLSTDGLFSIDGGTLSVKGQ